MTGKTLAVLGGVMAPPTKAHMALMLAAVNRLGAQEGVFVPSAVSYMRAWRADRLPPPAYLNTDFRLGMLRALCAGRANLRVCEREIHVTGGAYTVDTLNALAREPGVARVCFVLGADNLPGLEKWHNAEELLTKYPALIASRGDMDAPAIVRASPFLRAHAAAFTYLSLGDEFQGVSASRAREALQTGDRARARELLSPEVYEYILANMARALSL